MSETIIRVRCVSGAYFSAAGEQKDLDRILKMLEGGRGVLRFGNEWVNVANVVSVELARRPDPAGFAPLISDGPGLCLDHGPFERECAGCAER